MKKSSTQKAPAVKKPAATKKAGTKTPPMPKDAAPKEVKEVKKETKIDYGFFYANGSRDNVRVDLFVIEDDSRTARLGYIIQQEGFWAVYATRTGSPRQDLVVKKSEALRRLAKIARVNSEKVQMQINDFSLIKN